MRNTILWIGLAGWLAACSPMTDADGNYERNRCIWKDRVTELVTSNGTDTPFDDRVVLVLETIENSPLCETGGDSNDTAADTDTDPDGWEF